MANEIASFYAVINADTSGFQNGLNSVKTGMSSLTTGFTQLQDAVKVAFVVAGAAAAGFAASVATTGIQFDALKEQSQVAFTTMLGSGQAAQSMLNELQAFAQKTPFEFPDLIRASQRLMAMGISAQDVIPTLTAVGDAVAAMGGSAEMVDRVTTAIGQMNAKGKASGEEMRQLTEAGIPVWQMLADKIGVTVPEAMQKVTDGAITSSVAIGAITEGIETRFGGMMDAQSTTWNGIISNIKDGFTQLSGSIMQPFFDMAKEQLGKVVTAIGAMQTAFQHGASALALFNILMLNILPPDLVSGFVQFEQTLQDIYPVFVAIAGPIQDLIAKFVSWQDVFVALGLVAASVLASIVISFAPVIATFAAIVAAVAALRYAWQTDFAGIRTITQGTLEKIRGWIKDNTGVYLDSWDTFAKQLRFLVDFMWSNYVYFPIRSYLIQIGWWIRDQLNYGILTWGWWAQKIKEIIGPWVQWTIDKFNDWTTRFLDWYHGWADPVYEKISHWLSGVRDKFIEWRDRTLEIIKPWTDKVIQFFQPVIDWWDDHIQPFIDLGAHMIQGWWDAIQQKWYEFTNWFHGKWQDLVTSFKNFFGIHSPSTVFADYGSNMMLGLAKGIQAGQTSVHDAMGDLQAGITANMEPSYTYVASAPTTANTPQANSTARIEQLLETLIFELRNKNMSVTVNGGNGGSNLGALVAQSAGLRAAY